MGVDLRLGSVRLRTTLAASAVVGLALLVGSVAFVSLLRSTLTESLAEAAEGRAAEVVAVIERTGELTAPRTDPEEEVVEVRARDGSLIASSAGAGDPPVDDGGVVTARAEAGSAGGAVAVVVQRSLEDVNDSVDAVTGLLLAGAPLLLVVVAATTWHIVGRALAPVEAIRSEVDEISTKELHRRVPEPASDDEVGRLARTMNHMLGRLERSRDRQRSFVSDAAHELRSPLASIRQHAEVGLAHPDGTTGPELSAVVLAEGLRMQRLVDALLILARADEDSLGLTRQPVDLDDLVLDEARHLTAATRLRIDIRAVSAGRVSGDPGALGQVLRNLGDNAARHARECVAWQLHEHGDEVALAVEDDGPGVPPPDRQRVLDRFVRLDEARTHDSGGAGLGLAIVQELVVAHAGTVTIGEAESGGARVEIRLPRLTD